MNENVIIEVTAQDGTVTRPDGITEGMPDDAWKISVYTAESDLVAVFEQEGVGWVSTVAAGYVSDEDANVVLSGLDAIQRWAEDVVK